ncbi:MAG: DUF5722 domain-containing protein [Pirellulales bacterium]
MSRWFIVCVCWVACGLVRADDDAYPTARLKKGLQVQMLDDAVALGVGHATFNVDLTRLIAATPTTDDLRFTSDGREYAFRRAPIEDLDQRVKTMSDSGAVVYLILLPYVTRNPTRDAIMTHPDYARGEKNAGPIAMFAVDTDEGRPWLCLRPFLGRAVRRSSRPRSRRRIHRGERSQLALVLGQHGPAPPRTASSTPTNGRSGSSTSLCAKRFRRIARMCRSIISGPNATPPETHDKRSPVASF